MSSHQIVTCKTGFFYFMCTKYVTESKCAGKNSNNTQRCYQKSTWLWRAKFMKINNLTAPLHNLLSPHICTVSMPQPRGTLECDDSSKCTAGAFHPCQPIRFHFTELPLVQPFVPPGHAVARKPQI